MSDQGFSIKVDRETGRAIKELAAKEQRTIKTVVQRAIDAYSKQNGKAR